MAPGGSCSCRSPCRNFSPTDPVEDKLAKNPGLVEDPYSSNNSSALSCHPTPGPTLILVLNPAPTPTPASTNELFKKFIKAYLELNQRPRQPLAECK